MSSCERRAADESGMPMHAQDESCAAREPLCQSATRGAEGVVSGMSSWCVHVRRAAEAAADCDVLREQRRRKFSRLRGASSGASHGASPSF